MENQLTNQMRKAILEKYKNHKKVRFITGNNFQKKKTKGFQRILKDSNGF